MGIKTSQAIPPPPAQGPLLLAQSQGTKTLPSSISTTDKYSSELETHQKTEEKYHCGLHKRTE